MNEGPNINTPKKIQRIGGDIDFYPKSGLVGDYSQHFASVASNISLNKQEGLDPLYDVEPIPLYREYFRGSIGIPPVNESNLKNIEAMERLAKQANEIIEGHDIDRVAELLEILSEMEDLMVNGPK